MSAGQDLPPGAGDHPTLRDQLAMAALTGALANPDSMERPDNLAHYAYRIADAMLLARAGMLDDAS